MEKFDYGFCEFIEKEMYIITFEDFYANRVVLKKRFQMLSKNQKRFYMWYLYANIFMNETYKNYCWDYLNGYAKDPDLAYALRFYKVKKK